MGRQEGIKQPIKYIVFSATCLGEALLIIRIWDTVAGQRHVIHPNRQLYPGIDQVSGIAMDPPGPYNLNHKKLLMLDVELLLTIRTPYKGFDEVTEKNQNQYLSI